MSQIEDISLTALPNSIGNEKVITYNLDTQRIEEKELNPNEVLVSIGVAPYSDPNKSGLALKVDSNYNVIYSQGATKVYCTKSLISQDGVIFKDKYREILEKLKSEIIESETSNKRSNKITSIPLDTIRSISQYLNDGEIRGLANTSKEFNLDRYKFINLNLNRKESLEYCTNIGFYNKINSLGIRLDLQLKLDLSGYDQITDSIVSHLGNVHTLDLSVCSQITDISVSNLGNVHTLRLSGCSQITDASVSNLGNVHNLNLSGCGQITDVSVSQLGNVHTLNLSGCNKITDNVISYLRDIKKVTVIR